MKLAQVFKQAIEDGDWYSVCDVYQAITGEAITPPEVKQDSVEADLANIEMSVPEPPKQTGRIGKKKSSRHPEGDFIASSRGNNVPNQHAKRQARAEPLITHGRSNEFKDNQQIASNELVTKNPRLGVANPVPRGQRDLLHSDAVNTGKKVNVWCSLCGGQFQVSPALAHGFAPNKDDNVWKCNDCCSPTGRRNVMREENDI